MNDLVHCNVTPILCCSGTCHSPMFCFLYFIAVQFKIFPSYQSSGYSLCWMNLQVLLHYRTCAAQEGALVFLSLFRLIVIRQYCWRSSSLRAISLGW